jgi:adenosylmethionine-8-amino-7-oxononanoate aminotransferase
MFRGLEIVEDRATKTPFAPERAINKALKAAAFDAGLICYPMGGTIDGRHGDHVLLAPPFIIDDAQIEELVGKLGTALRKVLP